MNHSCASPVTERYLEHFTPNEFRFRWLDATACDPDLSRRGNHLAARIFTLWFESNHARTSYAELHRITAMSRKTLERALPELAERGWISVTHRGSNIELGLVMSEHGLDLLLEERERRQSFAGRRATNDEWTDRIITRLVTTLELHPEQVERLPRWRLLRAKIRSIVSHMLCYETESQKLFNTLTESLPTSIQDPAGMLLSRAGEHIRLHPHLSARAPRPKSGSSARFIHATIADIANSLTPPRTHQVL
jgi:DNA-binding GntR family transcriptional regulator